MKEDIQTKILKTIKEVNAQNPYYLIIGVLVLVLLLDYFLIMQFQLGALRTLGPRVMEIKSDIDLFEKNKGRIGKYKNTIKELDQKLESLQNRIKNTEDISEVLEGISRTANDNAVFFEQILPEIDLSDPAFENKQGRYFLLPVTMSARSGYHHFGRFLNDLEERGTLMQVRRLRITADPKRIRQHNVNVVIEAVVFEPAAGVKQ